MGWKIKLAIIAVAVLCMAPTRRTELDHVGAYNFMVEISGVEAGYFKGVDGLTDVFEASGTQETTGGDVRFKSGRGLSRTLARGQQANVRVNIVLERPARGLPAGVVCGIDLQAQIVDVRRRSLSLRPISAATDDCDVLRQ